MRRISFAALLAAGSLLIALAPAAGQAGQNSLLFPKKSRPYGVDIATWGERATQWICRQPLGRSPLFDDTGANCAVDQHGPVWFIARIAGPPVFSGTRSCTIPAHRALFLYIGADVEDYPCITGSPQQAVIDGFFMLFKPLERGEHTIVVHGTNTFGHDKTFTYHLTIE
jgi:hypothetical protein